MRNIITSQNSLFAGFYIPNITPDKCKLWIANMFNYVVLKACAKVVEANNLVPFMKEMSH